jgi:GMP synthase (glutamine-hydrolysing)
MIQHRRSAVALRHVAFEDLGLLAPVMEREGWDVSFCEAAVDDLLHDSIRNANLLVILGGPSVPTRRTFIRSSNPSSP